jgi:glycosyltransferase involved in cell wall biosynthesis
MEKMALVHDWLVGFAGGEKVLSSIYSIYPAKIYTLVASKEKQKGRVWEREDIETSFLQKIPFSTKLYRNFLPLFPLAIEQFDLSSYDVIISSSHAVAKGVLTHSQQLHICYCHSPMRYAWDLYHFHMEHVKGLKKMLARMTLHYLRNWDMSSSQRVDAFIANSHNVAKRIQKIYGRESTVIYPPVSTDTFSIAKTKEDYYVAFSRLVPYKKIDLIAQAFAQMPDKKLLIIGDGPEMSRIKKISGKNIEILGYLPDASVRELLSKAKAFVFAAEEDFGIVMVEALAAGVPVIAYGKGSSQEIVKKGETGEFFEEQTIASLCNAIERFEEKQERYDPVTIKKSAERFSERRFASEFKDFIEKQKALQGMRL